MTARGSGVKVGAPFSRSLARIAGGPSVKLLGQLRTPIPAMTVLVVAGLAVGLLAAPLAAEAQPVG